MKQREAQILPDDFPPLATEYPISDQQVEQFWHDGFIILPKGAVLNLQGCKIVLFKLHNVFLNKFIYTL